MSNLLINKKNILITGGTGSFGKKFLDIVLKKFKPKKIVIFSRDEQKQFILQNNISIDNQRLVRFFIGDVRDKDRLTYACRNIDIIIHAAALKHVPIAEYNPFEVIKTNILGAQNVIDAAIQNDVKRIVALSTDKASSPINLYGATKLASDKLFVAANNYKGSKDIRFSVVRYGNVMGSRGSVIPIFLKNKNKIFHITDNRMTRFNITLEEGVFFVIKSLQRMFGGEIFVPKIPSYNIIDIPKAIVRNPKFNFIGIRPGEKLHEEMISNSDALNTIEYKDHFVILPRSEFVSWGEKDYLNQNKGGKKCKVSFSYNSRDNKVFLSVEAISKLIKKSIPDIEF